MKNQAIFYYVILKKEEILEAYQLLIDTPMLIVNLHCFI